MLQIAFIAAAAAAASALLVLLLLQIATVIVTIAISHCRILHPSSGGILLIAVRPSPSLIVPFFIALPNSLVRPQDLFIAFLTQLPLDPPPVFLIMIDR